MGDIDDSALLVPDGLDSTSLDELAIGVIKVDSAGLVLFYNKAESRLSGRSAKLVIGKNFFLDVAPCTNIPAFRGKFLEGVRKGKLDTIFDFIFDFRMTPVRVRVRMSNSSEPDKFWILVHLVEELAPRYESYPSANVHKTIPVQGEVVDLTACEQEPIATSGEIQPHGILLVFDGVTHECVFVSANWREILVSRAQQPLGLPYSKLLPASLHEKVRDLLDRGASNSSSSISLGSLQSDGGYTLTSSAHWSNYGLTIEIERGEIADNEYVLDWLASVLRQLEAESQVDELAQFIAREVRKLTGFERVLLYQFDREFEGTVVGEDKVMDWEQTFIGLRFPASDIPAQARALYLKNRARCTPTSSYAPVPLISSVENVNSHPLDLSMSRLRSVSPLHRQYHNNMGVDGSMSASIVVDGRLWGMLVGHHRKPHCVPQSILRAISVLVEAVGPKLAALQFASSESHRMRAEERFRNLIDQIVMSSDPIISVISGNLTLMDLIESQGAAVVDDAGDMRCIGLTPKSDEIHRILSWVRTVTDETLWSTECLSGTFPEAEKYKGICSGIVVGFIGNARSTTLIWFRSEFAQTITWAGDPLTVKKTTLKGFVPRTSFEKWIVQKRGYSLPWKPWELDICRYVRHAIHESLADRYHKVRVLNQELSQISESKSRFLAAASHELRTPLNAIIGYSELMNTEIGGVLNPKHKEYNSIVIEAAKRQLALIENILEKSQAEGGHIRLAIETFDLVAESKSIVNMHLSAAQKLSLKIAEHYPSGPILIDADRQAVGRCIDNLVSNAIKYTPRDGSIVISLAANKRKAEIVVADNGIGIAKDKQHLVTQPFYQANSPMVASPSGIGLGLSLVKSLVNAHGGELLIESEPNKGTTVKVILPL